jgi:hypothetical protein
MQELLLIDRVKVMIAEYREYFVHFSVNKCGLEIVSECLSALDYFLLGLLPYIMWLVIARPENYIWLDITFYKVNERLERQRG